MSNRIIQEIRSRLKADESVAPLLEYIGRLEYQLSKARRERREFELRLIDIEAIDGPVGAKNDLHDGVASQPVKAANKNNHQRG